MALLLRNTSCDTFGLLPPKCGVDVIILAYTANHVDSNTKRISFVKNWTMEFYWQSKYTFHEFQIQMFAFFQSWPLPHRASRHLFHSNWNDFKHLSWYFYLQIVAKKSMKESHRKYFYWKLCYETLYLTKNSILWHVHKYWLF